MPDYRMWGQALRIIPRIGKDEWDRLDLVSRWLVATRSAVFIMTATSAAVGGLLAFRDGRFSLLNFLACLLGLVFAHATNNLVNDLIDYKRGIDHNNYYRAQYGPQPLEHGLLSTAGLSAYIAVSGILAILCGLFLVWRVGMPVAWLMAAGAFFVVFYTWPLKNLGLGEPTVLLVWGPLMVGGSYFVTTGGAFSGQVLLISIAYAVGPTTVLMGKHTDKLLEDEQKGVRTLPVVLGQKKAQLATIGLWVFQWVLTMALVATGVLGWVMLGVLPAFKKFAWAVNVYSKPRPTEPPEELPPDVWPLFLSAVAFVYNRLFGILFLGCLLLDVILTRLGIY